VLLRHFHELLHDLHGLAEFLGELRVLLVLPGVGQAIMDPQEVRRFAEELKRFNTDLHARAALLQGRFNALADTWQDQEHAKFAEEFRQSMKVMQKFMEVSQEHIPYLLRKAQRIEDYLNQR
jgi:uncharacterized protein YukE